MKLCYVVVCPLIALAIDTASGLDLRDVIADPRRYSGRQLDLVGIARVPGYFYLFADLEAAAKTDLSKALLVRKNNFAGSGYRELDRQWVRVTGVISSEPRRGWDPGTGVLLQHAKLVRDRPPPRIAEWTVLGVFQNATTKPLAIDLIPRSDGGRTTFLLSPHQVDKTIIDEGQAVVSQLNGPNNMPLDERKAGKPFLTYEIRFRQLLPPDYEYSPEWSSKRTLYYRITRDRIDLIPASEARDWKVAQNR